MAKLNFKYGTVGFSFVDSAEECCKTYAEKGSTILFIKTTAKNKFSEAKFHESLSDANAENSAKKSKTKNKIDLQKFEDVEVVSISAETNLVELFEEKSHDKKIDVVVVEDAQLCTTIQVENLRKISENANVFCFGLKVNFDTQLFEGSKRLLEISDSVQEIKTDCRCKNKATMNAHFINGFLTFDVDEEKEGKHTYQGLCYACFKKELRRTNINNQIVKYLAIFKDMDTAGDWSSDTPMDNVILQKPFVIYDEDVKNFVQDFHEFEINNPEKMIVVPDNVQALKKISVKDQSFDYVMSLISYVIKMERIRPGMLKELIEDGTMTKWLRQIKKTISE